MPQATRTQQAEDDLVDILHAVARRSVKAAERLRDDIDATITRLVSFPRLGRPCAKLAPGLFRYAVSGHLIFYYITDEGIEVVRVLDGARNITSDMFDD